MKHKWIECDCGKEGCMFCDGGLGACSVCGGLEGALPSDCPCRKMTQEEIDLVYKGEIDFVNEKWEKSCSPNSPAYYRNYEWNELEDSQNKNLLGC